MSLLSPTPMTQIKASDVKVGDTVLMWLGRIPNSSRTSSNSYRYKVTSIEIKDSLIIFSTARNGKLKISSDENVYILS